MTFEVGQVHDDMYALIITDSEGISVDYILDGGEIRQLIQTLDNAIL